MNKKKLSVLLRIILLILLLIIIFIFIKFSNGIDLIQLSPQTEDRMMGYIIKTKNNKIIAIDSGTKGDTENLLNYIKKYGGKVDAWFLTHPHYDHVTAFEEIVKNESVEIGNIYVTLNDIDLINENDVLRVEDAKILYDILQYDSIKDKVKEVYLNQIINIDNINIEILGVKNPEIIENFGNNSSMILKLYINDKSLIFLGDTGIESGNKLIENQREKLKSDYVQVSHHGQSGVSEEVYKLINPTYCLWPTPLWLWNNDNGGGEDSGDWKTKETRSWIEKINVKENYIAKDGDIKIRIW